MSYCVNCGVELEASLEVCPLCNTPVLNPKDIPYTKKMTPFPTEKGQVETVKRKDMGILLTIVVLATSITCGLLNFLVFNQNLWSLFVIGGCVLLWVFMIPAVIYSRFSIYAYLLIDGMCLTGYLYMIALAVGSRDWYFGLALPIIVLLTILVEALVLCLRKLPVTFITTALFIFIATEVLCVGIEIFIDLYTESAVALSWSAVVLTVCSIINVTLLTLLSRRRLRNAVRRRLHF